MDRARLPELRVEAAAREEAFKARRRDLARWLWARSKPANGTFVKTYLKTARGIDVAVLATIRCLPGTDKYYPAMIAPFTIPEEPEPGVLSVSMNKISGVHLTKLRPDGSGKADVEPSKIMVGRTLGVPIVLAPPNDLLGLAITEGIEDALSVHLATGLGAWAAGSAAHMPALVAAVPNYIEAVTVFADADKEGRENAMRLAAALFRRDREIRVESLRP